MHQRFHLRHVDERRQLALIAVAVEIIKQPRLPGVSPAAMAMVAYTSAIASRAFWCSIPLATVRCSAGSWANPRHSPARRSLPDAGHSRRASRRADPSASYRAASSRHKGHRSCDRRYSASLRHQAHVVIADDTGLRHREQIVDAGGQRGPIILLWPALPAGDPGDHPPAAAADNRQRACSKTPRARRSTFSSASVRMAANCAGRSREGLVPKVS